MKKIDDVDLSALLDNAYADILKEDVVKVELKIRAIANDMRTADIDVEKASRALKKAEEKRDKLNAKIAKIKAGDWTVIDGEPTPKTEDKEVSS